jgi:hypothetical protein
MPIGSRVRVTAASKAGGCLAGDTGTVVGVTARADGREAAFYAVQMDKDADVEGTWHTTFYPEELEPAP